MQSVLEYLAGTDEVGLVSAGQSNRVPHGDRDAEGYVTAPHLKLRAAGQDLTIAAIASATAGAHGAIGTRSIVTVLDSIVRDDWKEGEIRLVQHEHGDSVTSSLRVGHARVLSCQAFASNSTATGLAFNATTNTVIWAFHGRLAGSQVTLSTTGTLPVGSPGQVLYVVNVTESTFQVSDRPFGSALSFGAGSGTHTMTARPFLEVSWQSAFQAAVAGVTFSIGTPGTVNHASHPFTNGSSVAFTGTVPPELTAGTKYFVTVLTAGTYQLSASPGGALINFSGAGGTVTATPDLLTHVSGYVHLHDRFNSYDNVLMVTPYQPIEPGDYPAGVPVVPGVTLASDVLSHADAALALPYAWNEGVEGFGAAGTATVSGLVATPSGGTMVENLFAGGFLRLGGSRGRVASNTSSTITVESWIPAAPGAGSLPYELHLPHWRNNPHHFTAGEGFLYPSGNMQPGGSLPTSTGLTYSRPRGRLAGSYVGRLPENGAVSSAIVASGVARLTTTASAQLTASVVSGKLRIQRATTSNDPATGLIQFEHLLRPGYIVQLSGLGQTPTVDGFWRVAAMVPSTSSTGSYVDLDPFDATLASVPGSVSGTVPAAATVTRLVYRTTHLFGSLIELAWRMAVAVGRRIVVAHLGINAAGQILRNSSNPNGFQGKLGWYDDNEALDWTPSNDDGLAARLKRLVEFIAPRAVRASLGATKAWKVLAIDVWQGETDAQSEAGRQLAGRSIPTFISWLRSAIVAAGLSPYPSVAKVPLHWAQITTNPWEILGLGGDTTGQVNAAIVKTTRLDGFAASYDPDLSPKLSLDPLHFNGVGEAINGRAAAELLLPLIELAFQFRLTPAAVTVANDALSIIGDSPNVTSLEPPNATQQARLCAQFIYQVRDQVLQSHAFSFSRRRIVASRVEGVDVSTWLYAYAVPPDMLHPIAVLASDASDDAQTLSAVNTIKAYGITSPVPSTQRVPASQPFRIETDQLGNRLLRTNQADAVFIYTANNVDFAVWDPLVRNAAVYALAYRLAGATMKGRSGASLAQTMMQTSLAMMAQAAAINAQFQADQRIEGVCPWLP